jgi:hypothetical protein
MPRRELKHPSQVEEWVQELSRQLTQPGRMTLIGSGALLWHAAQRGLIEPLSENSMDVDPITDSEEIARLCYDALIGSEFERIHGWREFDAGPCSRNSPPTGVPARFKEV